MSIICKLANSVVCYVLTSERQFSSKNDTKKMNDKYTNYWSTEVISLPLYS